MMKSNTSPIKGLWAVYSAIIIFGFTALFSKLIVLPALEITFLRSIVAVLAILMFIVWRGESLRLANTKDYALAVLLGTLLATHWVTYFYAMQISTVAVGVIALYTFPIITVFLEPLFHGERVHIKDVISALAVLFGIYLLVPEFSVDNQITQGLLWGVFSAFLFALRNIIQGRYFSAYKARHSLFYQTLVTFLVLFPFSFEVIPNVSEFQWLQLVLLGIFFTAVPHILFAFSLSHLKAKTVSLVACMQVVFATIFAVILLGEVPTVTTILGGSIVVATAMFESYTAYRKA